MTDAHVTDDGKISMTFADSYKEEQIANYGEEIAAREYERQREEGTESVVEGDYERLSDGDQPY